MARDYQDRFEEFFRDNMAADLDAMASEYSPSTRSLRIDYGELEAAEPSLAEDLLQRPDTLRQKAHAAMLESASGLERAIAHAGTHARANVRIRGLPEEQHRLVGKCRTNDLGTLLCVEGEVSDTERVSPLAEIAGWECQYCGTITRQHQRYGKMVQPHACQGCERKGAPFVLEESESELVDHQEIALMPPDPQRDDLPFLTVFLDDDITDSVGKGDVVSVVGVYDTLPGQNETVLQTFLDAYDLDVETYAEAGADSRELETDIIDYVLANQNDGASWGVGREATIQHFEADGIRRREIENTIEEAKEQTDLSETNGTLVVMEK